MIAPRRRRHLRLSDALQPTVAFFPCHCEIGISLNGTVAARPGRAATQRRGSSTRAATRGTMGAQGRLPRARLFAVFGRAAIIVAALVLVALTWIGARDAIRAHRSEARARVQAEVLATTLAFEEQLRRELLSLDQTLRILEYEWQRDPDHFDLAARVAPGGRAGRRFAATVHRRCAGHRSVQLARRRSSAPMSAAVTISATRPSLPADDGKMFVGELTQGQVTRAVADQPGPPTGQSGRLICRRDRRLVRHQFVHAVLSRGRSRQRTA